MTDQLLFSVVIPTYNHALLLKEALESVRAQTCSDWQAIVVNNYSEDDTEAIVEGLHDNRIELVNFRNQGVIGASRNEGIRRSRGEYVALLDSDDIWYPEKLARCLDALRDGCDLVCHGQTWTYEDGSSQSITFGPSSNATYEGFLFLGNCMSTSATVIRRSLLEQVGAFSEDPAFATAEDLELWLRVAKVTDRFCFLEDILGGRSFHGANASRQGPHHMNAALAVTDHHYESEIQTTLRNQMKYRIRRSRIVISGARRMAQGGDYRRAGSLFVDAFMLWPFDWRVYALGLVTMWEWRKRLYRDTKLES